ncbi:DUF423 domain-containing protein [Halopseudomonas salegens]|uniref:Uncharacterized membrane protein YgdD, TMEM256/DUF423 family n=1 Tax=Halopseudomonas salegens TaxID=1434072 RepID=A0A1H2E1E8_9GAMM|nr:DUF423 domain-containing protein [Halopseudomonas salegens]SDT88972.1 Uncharacterized membrane protein YgdD, TMEM256/DUF423 family [Halopseudomonas salegens]
MAKWFLLLSAISGFTAVAFGAFAAHGLRGQLPANLLAAFQTGVQYQFWHTGALIGVALLLLQWSHSRLFKAAGIGYITGILLFSGSLYLMALSGITALGIITPFGGVSFLIAWLLFGLGVWRQL